MVLTAMGSNDHSIITLQQDRNQPNQIFKMEKVMGPWYKFKLSQHDGKCLDYDKSNHNLQVYRRHVINDDNQKWQVIEQGQFRMILSKSGNGNVMTCSQRGVGVPMEVRANMGGNHQKFTIKQVCR